MSLPDEPAPAGPAPWDSESLVIRGEDRARLLEELRGLRGFLARRPAVVLQDLAFSVNGASQSGDKRLAVVAGSVPELDERLARAAERLSDPSCRQIRDIRGIYFFDEPLHPRGRLAFLFPGEGSQYLGMLGDLRRHFPAVDEWLQLCDAVSRDTSSDPRPRSRFLTAVSADGAERAEAERELWQFTNAVVSVLMGNLTLSLLLQELGLRPDVVAGHSTGELAALVAAGCFDDPAAELKKIAVCLHELERQQASRGSGGALLLAVGASREVVAELLERAVPGGGAERRAYVAMDNCPHQTVVVGLPDVMETIEAEVRSRNLLYERLALDRPYHTPLFESSLEPLRRMYAELALKRPRMTVYSGTTARPFPEDAEEIRRLSLAHWTSRVEFRDMVESLYADGVRIFVEAGPRGNLCTFVEDTLRGRTFLAVPANVPRRSGTLQLNHLVAQLAAQHVPLRLDMLYERRQPQRIEWRDRAEARPPSGAWPAYFAAMHQFLDAEREILSAHLNRRLRTAPLASAGVALLRQDEGPRPLGGEVVQRSGGRQLVARRRLTLEEDLYAAHHAVGGQEVSRVDPLQRGQEIMPASFILEMMAEVAACLVPGQQVLALKDIHLLRWLAYDGDAPRTVEISARVHEPGEVVVEVHDLGSGSEGTPRLAAKGTVELGATYPQSPAPDDSKLTDPRPCEVTLELLYNSLFHGPLFRCVQSLDRIGRDWIEATLRVPERTRLFRSTTEPAFLLDPMTLDIAMHPLAGWHVSRPDQSGRTLLPYALDRIEFYGPRPEVGARLRSRVRTVQETVRHFVHDLEVVGADGRVWCRMAATRYWRFYLPYQETLGFNSPKELYIPSREWPEGLPPADPTATPAACCAVLRTPGDLLQPGLQLAGARVCLTPRELQEYRGADLDSEGRSALLFLRIAAKDAVRLLWAKRNQERMFMADIEIALDSCGRAAAVHRDPARGDPLPRVCVDRLDGISVALAAVGFRPGIAVARLEGGTAPEHDAARLDCARRAAAAALGGVASRTSAGELDVETVDAAAGIVRVLGLTVRISRTEDVVLATALGPP